jgi:hypothetical protein
MKENLSNGSKLLSPKNLLTERELQALKKLQKELGGKWTVTKDKKFFVRE